MNFKSHVIGGGISSTLVACSTLVFTGQALDIAGPVVLFASCLFMSLFPDLDTASIPQRWFYRLMLVFISYLYIYESVDILYIAAILCITPLLDKHRGWTHWRITPFIIAITCVFFYDKSKGLYDISKFDLIVNYSLFIFAIVLGHYTHLLLDSKTIKMFRNSGDHH